MATATKHVQYQGRKGMVTIVITAERSIETEKRDVDGFEYTQRVPVERDKIHAYLDDQYLTTDTVLDRIADIPAYRKLRDAGIVALINGKVGLFEEQYQLVEAAYRAAIADAKDDEWIAYEQKRQAEYEADAAHERHVDFIDSVR